MTTPARSFRPELTALSDRICPAVTYTQTGPVLLIAGDRTDNRVVVTPVDDGGVRVEADGQAPVSSAHTDRVVFQGAGGNDDFEYKRAKGHSPAIEIETLGGRDRIRVTSNNDVDVSPGGGDDKVEVTQADDGAEGDFLFRVDSGAGNDQVIFAATKTKSESLSAPHAARATIDLGAGDDLFFCPLPGAGNPPEGDRPVSGTFDLTGGAGDDRMIMPCVFPECNIRATLGGGNDLFDGVVEGTSQEGADGNASVAVSGDAGNDTIRVAFGNTKGLPATQLGIVGVIIDGGAGDDNADVTCSNVAIFRDMKQSIDLGGGAGTVGIIIDNSIVAGEFTQTINTGNGPDTVDVTVRDSAFTGAMKQSIGTGAGADTVSTIVQSTIAPGEAMIDLDTGADNDTATVIFRDANDLMGPQTVDINAGGGDDSIAVIAAAYEFYRPSTFVVDGGAGDDMFAVLFQDIDVVSQVRIGVTAGAGNDSVTARIEQPDFVGAASLALGIDGGGGDDHIEATGADPAGDLYGETGRARFDLNVAGGAGTDEVHVFAGSTTPERIDEELQLDWSLAVTGDAGDDQIDILARNILLIGGTEGTTPQAFQLRVDGSDGGDTISANLLFDPRSQGIVDAEVFGGRGAENLTLAIFGTEALDRLFALVDGGDGSDLGRVTRNVSVRNVEALAFIP